MSKVDFEISKFLKTIGLKKYAEILWNYAEDAAKKEKWPNTQFNSLYKTYQSALTNTLAPRKEVFENLVEKQIYSQSTQFFDVFGFTTLRNFFTKSEIGNIDKLLSELKNSSPTKNNLYFSPVEGNESFQEIIFYGPLFDVTRNIIGPFWYIGSDAAVRSSAFPLHRDTFYNPPLYKIIIATEPSTFQILCGSHHINDYYARSSGQYICDWDKPSIPIHGCTSIYFDHINEDRKIVGYDDSQKNPPLTNIPLGEGDVFIFNQNLIHGLLPANTTTSFIAITVFPSPENSKKFNFGRQEHMDRIIKSAVSSYLVEKDLSGRKKIQIDKVPLPTKGFSEKNIEKLLNNPKLKEYFGFAKVPISKWEEEIKNSSHLAWEILRDDL